MPSKEGAIRTLSIVGILILLALKYINTRRGAVKGIPVIRRPFRVLGQRPERGEASFDYDQQIRDAYRKVTLPYKSISLVSAS